MIYVIIANIFYLLSVSVSIKRQSASYAPVAFFGNMFINGFLCLNLTFSLIFFGNAIDDFVFFLYSIIPVVTSIPFILLSFNKNVIFPKVEKAAIDDTLTISKIKKNIIIFSIPFFFIAFKILFVGIDSGEDFLSRGWRSEISHSMRGVEFLIYNSGSVILSLFLGYIAKLNIKSVIVCVLYSALLLIYGGRFLFGIAIIIGLYIKYIDNIKDISIKKPLIFSFITLSSVLVMAFIRYSNFGRNSAYGLKLLYITLSRQLSGNVFDFSLSYKFVSEHFVSKIIIEKLRVALLPMLSNYNLNITLGNYLAVSANRPWDHGHRISVVGEIYYLGGYIGIIAWALFFVFVCNFADKYADKYMVKSKNVNIAVFLFSLCFIFFVDTGYVFTGGYLYIYFCILIQISNILRHPAMLYKKF